MSVRIGKGKIAGINACADKKGVIAAAAMDQRGSLEKAIGKARGGPVTGDDLIAFKTAVTTVLTKHASAILLDPEYGLPAAKARAPGTGVLLAYEKTGYDTKDDSRLRTCSLSGACGASPRPGRAPSRCFSTTTPTTPTRSTA